LKTLRVSLLRRVVNILVLGEKELVGGASKMPSLLEQLDLGSSANLDLSSATA
jgi:hypothetical protein